MATAEERVLGEKEEAARMLSIQPACPRLLDGEPKATDPQKLTFGPHSGG